MQQLFIRRKSYGQQSIRQYIYLLVKCFVYFHDVKTLRSQMVGSISDLQLYSNCSLQGFLTACQALHRHLLRFWVPLCVCCLCAKRCCASPCVKIGCSCYEAHTQTFHNLPARYGEMKFVSLCVGRNAYETKFAFLTLRPTKIDRRVPRLRCVRPTQVKPQPSDSLFAGLPESHLT